MHSRAHLRRQMRAGRRALPPAERHRRAERMARRLAGTMLFRNSRRIAFYMANDGEMDPAPLMRRAWAMGKRTYLPVLCDMGSRHMWFAPFRAGDRLAPNRFGILEPVAPRTRARNLDLVLAPLVAFDPEGNRLGMGGGFYDHTLAFLTSRRHWCKPIVMGLAYQLQRVERLPHQPWDVPLAGIATETALHWPRRGDHQPTETR
jgi:5-formyltetrahydrofolate cyclo-ligase